MSVTHPLPMSNAKQTLKGFKTDVERALKAYLPSGQKPYRRVFVLLVSWSNASANHEEIDALEEVFQKKYNFTTEKLQLPISLTDDEIARDRKAQKALVVKLVEIVKELNSNDLFILYYGGHATHEYDKQRFSTQSQRPCMIHSNPIVVGHDAGPKGEKIPVMMSIKANLSGACIDNLDSVSDADVLYILDCCYASSLAIGGNRELLAASAIDRVAPGAGNPDSFTRVLVETLDSTAGRPFTVSQLHAEMVRKFYQNSLTTTPVHVELSPEMAIKGSIVLTPLSGGSTSVPSDQQNPRPFGIPQSQSDVILAITLSDVSKAPSAEQWSTWLSTHLPSGIEEIKIECEGVFRTRSAVLLVRMPVEVWNVLRGDPAYAFIAMVRSGNLMRPRNTVTEAMAELSVRDTREENIPVQDTRPGSSRGMGGEPGKL